MNKEILDKIKKQYTRKYMDKQKSTEVNEFFTDECREMALRMREVAHVINPTKKTFKDWMDYQYFMIEKINNPAHTEKNKSE